jgi:hypothetical protein
MNLVTLLGLPSGTASSSTWGSLGDFASQRHACLGAERVEPIHDLWGED